jgi:hypothetical protein
MSDLSPQSDPKADIEHTSLNGRVGPGADFERIEIPQCGDLLGIACVMDLDGGAGEDRQHRKQFRACPCAAGREGLLGNFAAGSYSSM